MKFIGIFLSCSLQKNMQKSDLKTGDHHAIFQTSKYQKYYKRLNKRLLFTFLISFSMAFLAQELTCTMNICLKTETEDHSIERLLSEKKYGGTTTSSCSATGEFLQYIYFVLVAKKHQKIRSRCLVHESFFTDIF